MLIVFIPTQKSFFDDDNAVYDFTTSGMKLAGINLVNNLSFRHAQQFSVLKKLTGSCQFCHL